MSEQEGHGVMMVLEKIHWPDEEPMVGRPFLDSDGIVMDIKPDVGASIAYLQLNNGGFVTIPVIMELRPATQEEMAQREEEFLAAQEEAKRKQQAEAIDNAKANVIALGPRPGEIEGLAKKHGLDS